MTTILLICSVALNLLLMVWMAVIWELKRQWFEVAMDWKKFAIELSATSESASTPATSTESPTPAPDAD